MSPPPLFLLYVSDDHVDESTKLRDILARSGVTFTEKNVSANPAHHADLIKRFGGQVSIPGIQMDDTWIAADEDNIDEVVGQYWIDRLLANGSSSSPTTVQDDDIRFDPQVKVHGDNDQQIGVNCKSLFRSEQLFGRSTSTDLSQYDDPTASMMSVTTDGSTADAALPSIKLPNGSDISYCNLVRILNGATKHQCEEGPKGKHYYFRGYEGLQLWTALFFDDTPTEDDVVAFGHVLIDRGIVQNYTPMCDNLRHSFLVLQPFAEPQTLNSFVKWPTDHISCDDDPMDVILRLSRSMDEICAMDENHEDRLSRFQAFEESVCQIQVVGLPEDPVEKVTFALNLFNLIIRHAMLICDSRSWSWPSNLDDLERFSSSFGYIVDSEWLSLSVLRASLYGRDDEVLPKLVSREGSFWERLFCREAPAPTALYYESKVVQNDPRILFAMTWGTKSSPVVSTIYPNRLGEGLQTAAETFCMRSVHIGPNKVVLPAVLSWFRADFGSHPEQVLFSILNYLSPDQLGQVRALRDVGRFDIVYDEFVWKHGVPNRSVSRRVPHPAAAAADDIANNVERPQSPTSANKRLAVLKRQGSSRSNRGGRRGRRRFIPVVCRRPSVGEDQPRVVKDQAMPSNHKLMPQAIINAPKRQSASSSSPATTDRSDSDDLSLQLGEDSYPESFQSVVSEITYGSEFEDLLLMGNRRRRHYGDGTSLLGHI